MGPLFPYTEEMAAQGKTHNLNRLCLLCSACFLRETQDREDTAQSPGIRSAQGGREENRPSLSTYCVQGTARTAPIANPTLTSSLVFLNLSISNPTLPSPWALPTRKERARQGGSISPKAMPPANTPWSPASFNSSADPLQAASQGFRSEDRATGTASEGL